MPSSTGNASFLQEDHDLARGHIRSQQAREHSTRLWKDITAHLNSLGGAVKTVEHGRRFRLTDTPASCRERCCCCQRPTPASSQPDASTPHNRPTRRRSLRAQNNYGQMVIKQEEQKLAQLKLLAEAVSSINNTLIELLRLQQNN